MVGGFRSPPPAAALSVWTAESYAALLALSIRHPGALDRLIGAPRHDPLTGCVDYEGTRHELSREINRSARGGVRLSICFIDLDGFKLVNDHHGHQYGNLVLAEVAQLLRDCVRNCDTVGRYGGDEFIAVLPQTDEPDAHHLAQRLASLLSDAQLGPSEAPVTASIGVAEWSASDTVDSLLARADNALLAAKTQRTGVMTASRLLAG